MARTSLSWVVKVTDFEFRESYINLVFEALGRLNDLDQVTDLSAHSFNVFIGSSHKL